MAPSPFTPDDVWRQGIENLRADIAERGLNYEILARASGVDRRMIGAILNGERRGSIVTHGKIAEAMGRDPGLYFPRSATELRRAMSMTGEEL